MNITMNIECSPEEARRLMGLPDLSAVHDLYLDRVKQAMTEGVSPDMIEQMFRSWTPMGDAGIGVWKQMIEQMTGGAAKT